MTDTIKQSIVHNENVHRPDPQSIDAPLEAKAAIDVKDLDAVKIGNEWCQKMQAAFDSQSADNIVKLFQGEKAYWR